jgi:hypothetical protein
MVKIIYVGDWAVKLGPVYAETPVYYAFKGLDPYYYGRWLKGALDQSGEHQVTDVAAWEFYKLGLGEKERLRDPVPPCEILNLPNS